MEQVLSFGPCQAKSRRILAHILVLQYRYRYLQVEEILSYGFCRALSRRIPEQVLQYLPVEEVLSYGSCRALSRRIPTQVLQLLVNSLQGHTQPQMLFRDL